MTGITNHPKTRLEHEGMKGAPMLSAVSMSSQELCTFSDLSLLTAISRAITALPFQSGLILAPNGIRTIKT